MYINQNSNKIIIPVGKKHAHGQPSQPQDDALALFQCCESDPQAWLRPLWVQSGNFLTTLFSFYLGFRVRFII